MIILAEKSSVAKDFAAALNCSKSDGYFKNDSYTITYCVGHLYKLLEPKEYGLSELPIVPDKFKYKSNPNTLDQTKIVFNILSSNKDQEILIATDADREGEVIARECLLLAGIFNFQKIKRFWVSQALTKEVILTGMKNAKPLKEYDFLANQGFGRQHADWLIGMNFSRYLTAAAGTKLPVGRVLIAILSALNDRCNQIKNFVSETYFEHYGIFHPSREEQNIKGIYFEETNDPSHPSREGWPDITRETTLRQLINSKAELVNQKKEDKITLPPQLYNLQDLQKEAFKKYKYSASETLSIVQSLYEELKCCSYPRTPSKVMGSQNVELCKKIAEELSANYSQFQQRIQDMDISLQNKRCFDDSKLEAHHALIPLKPIPDKASEKQKNIYDLILNRFFTAFLPGSKFQKLTYILKINKSKFRITGKKIIDAGFTKYTKPEVEEEELQLLEAIDFTDLVLSKIETIEKHTKPPKYFNEASILSFMENPKSILHVKDENNTAKLIGIGTPATRHTFIPHLTAYGYVEKEGQNIIVTDKGKKTLEIIKKLPMKNIANIEETTIWEEKLSEDPKTFEAEIVDYVKKTVAEKTEINEDYFDNGLKCPLCNKPIKESKINYFCVGYKDGCRFESIFKNFRGTNITLSDVQKMISGSTTSMKTCTKKDGSKYKCKFRMEPKLNYKIEPVFENKKDHPSREG